jgi:UDPglucose 6-dehydrogenase
MRVSIIGTGYVGLVTGVCMAEKGHQVICVDMNQEKVDQINRAIPPIYEHGLEELLRKNIDRGLHATTNLHASVIETDITLIAVGTPFNGKEIDLTYIKTVAHQIGRALRDKDAYHLVVVKSTVVPSTTDQVVLPILEEASGKKAGIHFGVGMNPEFLSEGEAIQDFMFPDRIILGGIDDQSIETLAQLYSMFAGVAVVRTNTKTAEMIKYTSNALLATMISFANEIGNLCATLGDIDVIDVMQGVHLNKYLSPIMPDGARVVPAITAFLQAGCGFGGSCLPKDVKALIAHGEQAGQPMRLLDAVIRINEQQPQQILSLLKKHFRSLANVRIAVLGLAFKPGTDDMRESPAIPIIHALLAQGATITAYDPYAAHQARNILRDHDIAISDDLPQAIANVDAIILVTRWEEFKNLPELLRHVHPQPLFVDGRRMLDKHDIARYEGIGW